MSLGRLANLVKTPSHNMAKNLYYFPPSLSPDTLETLQLSYRVGALARGSEFRPALHLPAVVIADPDQYPPDHLDELEFPGEAWCVLYMLPSGRVLAEPLSDRIFALLPEGAPRPMLERTIERAFESLHLTAENGGARREPDRTASDLETLTRIGTALSTERNTDCLLDLILTKSREITCCDAGSLYLVEEEAEGGKHLVFELTQSDSHSPSFKQYSLPIDEHSAAGYAAATATVLNIADAYEMDDMPFRLNRNFDRKFRYRTKSMLVVPMLNQKSEVIGVLQLINAKRDAAARLVSVEVVQEAVIPFSERSQQLAESLASQAAVALENSILYRDIQRLFEGFVKASVTAVESRDPATFGHSERVAKLTIGLAEAASRCTTGCYAGIHFGPGDLQELRYAALLHDFGKVGVREHVLVKAKKLYPHQLDAVRMRFLCARQAVELASAHKKLELALAARQSDAGQTLPPIDAEREFELRRLDEMLRFIVELNEPRALRAGDAERLPEKLAEVATLFVPGPAGQPEPLLSQHEVGLLSIPSGTLDA